MSQMETEEKFRQLAEEADRLIKAGRLSQVAALIHELNFSKIPRKQLQTFAKICRRAGLIGQGLRLMHPVVRQDRHADDPPTASEICEYSSLLSRNGSTQEAMALLEKVDSAKTPEAALYLGYCHISNWDYAEAVKYLKEFLALSSDPYSKLIAQVNLISCYIVISELTEASDLLENTIQMAEQMGASRLVGNCYELWGQVYFWQGDFAQSKKALNRALEIFGQTKSYDQLLIYKTESIMSALETKSLEPLIQFRQEALQRNHWESVREADLFRLKVQFNQRDLDHLVCGTPMAAYRTRIQQIVGASPSEHYILGSPDSKCLDLKAGAIEGGVSFPRGKKIHQVLASLLKDFYVPRNIGTLFAELYPGEYFDIETSPFRVRQLILRTRQWLKENQIPISIEQEAGAYRLHVQNDFGIKITLETPKLDPFFLKWTELQRAFAGMPSFSAEQACTKLGWSRSSLRRVIDWALQNSHVRKTGVGKSTLYHLDSETSSSDLTKSQAS